MAIQVHVAKYCTEVLLVRTTGTAVLRNLIDKVQPSSVDANPASIRVLLGQLPPSAAATQTVSATVDAPVAITVVATDDVPNGVLTYQASAASNGTVTGGTGGKFTYTPNKDFAGVDSFVVTVTDVDGLSTKQTVTVSVVNVNDAPTVAATQAVSATGYTSATCTVAGPDL